MSDFFGMAHVIPAYTTIMGNNNIVTGGYNTCIGIGYNANLVSGTNNNIVIGVRARDTRLMRLVLSSQEFKLAVLARHKKINSILVDMLGIKCDLVNRKVKEYLFMECPYYV
jgi:hypothetical protein